MLQFRIVSIIALIFVLSSCSQDSQPSIIISNGQNVAITASFEEEGFNRAEYNDSGLSGLENIDLSGDWTIRYALQVYMAGSENFNRYVMFSDDYQTTFNVKLVPGRSYRFVVWADIVDEKTDKDLYYDTADFEMIKNIGDDRIMNEYRDAFTGMCKVDNLSSQDKIKISLVRPFAKLRIITTDIDIVQNFRYQPNYGEVVYNVDIPQSFNAYEGRVNKTPASIKTFAYTIPTYGCEVDSDGAPISGRKTIFSDYIFSDYEPSKIKLDVTIRDTIRDEQIASIAVNSGVPIVRNNITTIVGRMLTDGCIEGLYTPITEEGGDEF